MAYYEENFTLENKSMYTLTLDRGGSSGLGDGKWPDTLKPAEKVSFQQSGNFQINVTALYVINTPTPQDTYMHFYLSAFGAGTVHMFLKYSSGAPLPNSFISESNSNGVITNDNFVDGTVSIDKFGLTTRVGSAVFAIG